MHSAISFYYSGDLCSSRNIEESSISYEQLQEILRHQQELDSSLQIARECLTADRNANEDASQAVAAAQSHGIHANKLLKRIWDLVPSLKHTSDRTAAKAQEVFATPELLEDILSRLTSHDKLQAMQVQRTWRDTVLGSVRLKRELGLIPFEDGKYYSAFSHRFREARRYDPLLPGGSYVDDDPEYFEWDKTSEYSFWAWNQRVFEDPNLLEIRIRMQTSVELGSRVASMRLCDPPITAVKVFPGGRVNCQHEDAIWGDTLESSVDCFTVGELLQLAQRVRAEHSKCMFGYSDVEFVAGVKLSEDDMIMVERRRMEQQAIARRNDRRAVRQSREAEEERARESIDAWQYEDLGRSRTERDEGVNGGTNRYSDEDEVFDDRSVDDVQDTYNSQNDGQSIKERQGDDGDQQSIRQGDAPPVEDEKEGSGQGFDESSTEEGARKYK
ncbi:hypothetical protein HII31_00157 [Pseudocercospora fuligena]|uniref:F-box domain-containing protein n=1 Tax=Pseudocercospora fuligena TaxID=685502 RepID=A0A8H6VN37_9PEZI|nr:hypothetical protein HII31_00157 [Pseudocercospora fuligena]